MLLIDRRRGALGVRVWRGTRIEGRLAGIWVSDRLRVG